MEAPKRDTAWGPMEVHFQAAREAHAALQEAGLEVELHQPNLPIFAEEGEAKRLAKKKADEPHEWRGDAFLLLKDRERLLEALSLIREQLAFQQIVDVTAVDFDAEDSVLWGVYQVLSLTKKARLTLKVHLPKDDCRVASAVSVYPGADWHERESGEMYGITYEGHPDPRNILLPDDWVGYPLRKDYEFPEEYHGISCV
ncbi:MAG: NADH-quinone oxidoreductase subunit C [Planctomycetota bacterium]|nr:MAG: NADH-quinone oxidoreductase subunit C [Planctomycetota bacterium]